MAHLPFDQRMLALSYVEVLSGLAVENGERILNGTQGAAQFMAECG
jgi:hypothetical protein